MGSTDRNESMVIRCVLGAAKSKLVAQTELDQWAFGHTFFPKTKAFFKLRVNFNLSYRESVIFKSFFLKHQIISLLFFTVIKIK